MFKFFNLKTTEKGFTLVELLVAMGIFSVIIGAISGIFIIGLRQQRITLVNQAISDQISFSLEFMGRALRVAKKELSAPTCLSQNGLNYEITRSGAGLKFINHLENDSCSEFFLEQGQLKYIKNTAQPVPVTLTSSKLEISSLKFNLSGASQSDNLQPLVTIFMEIKGKGEIESSQKMRIQTSISQRNLDVLQ
jgi:prepilin-type N-terminal cleavage/methylation domain-containing protein